jgi:hypothetical protein
MNGLCYAKSIPNFIRRCRIKLYDGIDLHANSHYLGVINEQNNVLFRHKMANDLWKTLRCSGILSGRA